MSLPFLQSLAHDVHVIDTGYGRPRFDAAYLVVDGGRAAFIDTGTALAVPRLLQALPAVGLGAHAVDYVIVTHVHLDHAGGAGLLMRQLPNARLVVHPLGAPHLIDPEMLIHGTREVFGAEMYDRSYGEIVPVPASRVVNSEDGMVLALGERLLTFVDTPGHAPHHHCIWDERSTGFFTGDAFGLSYREFDSAQGAWALPATPPVGVDPEAMRASIERLLAFQPARMYLTHYGPVEDVPRLGAQLLAAVQQQVDLGLAVHTRPDRHDALKQGLTTQYVGAAQRSGCRLPRASLQQLLEHDIDVNAQGMAIWLDRRAARPAPART